MTEQMSGAGFCVIRSGDIVLADHEDHASALDQFRGEIVEMIPSVSRLDLQIGKKVYSSFNASATHFIPGNQESHKRYVR